MVQQATKLQKGQTVWVRSNNMKKAAIAVIDEVHDDLAGHPFVEVILPPGVDYFDWDDEQKFIKYDDCRVMQVPLFRLEPVKY